ncbi:MAG: glutamine-hydrolyzing GMP synthase [bacterium]
MTLAADRPFVAVLDFGGQYTHLIANRIRRLGVYSEILPPDAREEDLEGAVGIILSGGPSSVYDASQPPFNAELFEQEVPMLGLCYGHQLLAQQMGGQVVRGEVREYGAAAMEVEKGGGLLEGLEDREQVWMSHGDQVVELPEGFQVLGRTRDCPVAAMGDPDRRRYGLQFHPEVTHTPHGMRVLDNFLDLCETARDWNPRGYVEHITQYMRKRVGEHRVLLLVSGGVDSTVCFALLNRALGEEQVLGLHIDNGLMRKGESGLVARVFREEGYRNLEHVDASGTFLDALEGVVDPEEKRRIIGRVFVEVAHDHLAGLGLEEGWVLAQGTIYPDTIETGGTRHAATIKTHHNRVEEIELLIEQGKVVEPLADLYKDEVREAGLALGLPGELVWRHPFPGPGLGVRLLCDDGIPLEPEQLLDLGEAEEQARTVAGGYGYEARVLPIRSVGVQGDFRTYAHPVALFGGDRDWRTLEEVSTRLTNSIDLVNRVVYALRPGAPAEFEAEAAVVTRERLDQLREADALAMEHLRSAGRHREVWQMPTVLVPLSVDGRGESVVLRPVLSQEAMTARFADLPWDVVEEMARRIGGLEGISGVFYDVTHKPPGTIEWE